MEVSTTTWQHLKNRKDDKWTRPLSAVEDQAHLMVQVMEAWFLADPDALSTYYGQGFLVNSLPGRMDIEKIEKEKVFKVLSHATKRTQKGEYHKTRHGFDLLERIDPNLVRAASLHAEALLSVLAKQSRTRT